MAAIPVSGESFVGQNKALGRRTLGFSVHITFSPRFRAGRETKSLESQDLTHTLCELEVNQGWALRPPGSLQHHFYNLELLVNVPTPDCRRRSTPDPQIFNWERLLLWDSGKIFSEASSFLLLVEGRENFTSDHSVNTQETKGLCKLEAAEGPGWGTPLTMAVYRLESPLPLGHCFHVVSVLVLGAALKGHQFYPSSRSEAGLYAGLQGEVAESWGPRQDMTVLQPHTRRHPARFQCGEAMFVSKNAVTSWGRHLWGAVLLVGGGATFQSVPRSPGSLALVMSLCSQYLGGSLFSSPLQTVIWWVSSTCHSTRSEPTGPTVIHVADLPSVEARPPHTRSSSSVCGA